MRQVWHGDGLRARACAREYRLPPRAELGLCTGCVSLHCAEAVKTIASGLGCDEVALALVDFGGLLEDCHFVLAPLGEAENFGMWYEGLAEQVKVIGPLR